MTLAKTSTLYPDATEASASSRPALILNILCLVLVCEASFACRGKITSDGGTVNRRSTEQTDGSIGSVHGAGNTSHDASYLVEIEGSVRLRSEKNSQATAGDVAKKAKIEVLRVLPGERSVELIQTAAADEAGHYVTELDGVISGETLLVVAYQGGSSIGQTLLPISAFLDLVSAGNTLHLNGDINPVSSIASTVAMKIDTPLSALSSSDLKALTAAVEKGLNALGTKGKSLSLPALLNKLLATKTFIDDLALALPSIDTTRDRDAVAAEILNFIEGRIALSPKTGESEDLAPVRFDALLASRRTWFQTRSSIVLTINEAVLEANDSFALTNVTLNTPLVAAQSVWQATTNTSGYDYTPSSGRSTLRLFPRQLRNGITYGTNLLQLTVDSPVANKYTQAQIKLHDFPVFASVITYFAIPRQTLGGFQGGLTVLSGAALSANGSQLITEPLRMVNQ